MGTIVKDGTIVHAHIEIPRGAMEIRLPVPEGYVAEIISDGLIAIRPVESEDEKIREELIGHCKDLVRMNQDDKVMLSIYEPWLTWLEKKKDSPMPEDTVIFQKGVEEGRRLEREEQKPEWSEEDEKMVETICKEGDLKPSEQRWLKSLKNRGNSPQSNTNSPSWSEEDEKKINAIVGVLDYQATLCQKRIAAVDGFMLDELIDWLKFLRPSWKPSEEQMRAFHELLGGKVPRAPELYELYNDLEKLM